MILRRLGTLLLVPLCAGLLLTACGGGGARTTQISNTTTKGQELLDLKKAYDSGILTEREYNSQRQTILDRDE